MKRAAVSSRSQFICSTSAASSTLESISTHSILASFLSVLELVHMRRCSHKFYELYKLAFLSTATWTETSLLRLSEQERDYIRCLEFAEWRADYVFPPRLTSFSFNDEHMRSLPNTLTELRFGDQFTKSLAVDVLPCSLVKVVFGRYFNKELLPGVLPFGLIEVVFGDGFNSPLLPGVLPAGLKCLKFGISFSRALGFSDDEFKAQSVLPASLTKLELSKNFNFDLGKFLPHGLVHLVFPSEAQFFYPLGPLPTLATLWLGDNYYSCPQLPTTLTTLRIGRGFKSYFSQQTLPVFPSNLTMLDLGMCPHKNILPGDLPSSLLDLQMSKACDQSIDKAWLPPSLTRLFTGGPNSAAMYPKGISVGMLPSTLTELEFGEHFGTTVPEDLLEGTFPSSLTRLIFGFNFNRPISLHVLPSKLLELWFGFYFNQPIMPGVLPPTLHLLHGGYEFHQDLTEEGVVPLSVTSITGGTRLRVPVDFERCEIQPGSNRAASVSYRRTQ